MAALTVEEWLEEAYPFIHTEYRIYKLREGGQEEAEAWLSYEWPDIYEDFCILRYGDDP